MNWLSLCQGVSNNRLKSIMAFSSLTTYVICCNITAGTVLAPDKYVSCANIVQ